MDERLTAQQRQAVYDRGGKLLVSAAAGSGKTKVLVDRLLSYVLDPIDPADLNEFLIITYTKAAASELRGKIAAKLSEQIAKDPGNIHLQKQMQLLFLAKISTVHSFCADILREYAYKLDLSPDFRVADETETREMRDLVLGELLDDIYKETDSNPDVLSFIDSQGLGRDDRYVPEILEKVYDSARCHLNPDQWLEQCLSTSDIPVETDISQTLWGQYLILDLKEYLSVQTGIFRECLELLNNADGMEKPAANIQSLVYQLEHLQDASTWDDIVAYKNIDYGRLTFPRKNVDEELVERIKAVRNACKKSLERKLLSFSDDSGQIRQDMAQASSGMRGLVFLVNQFQRRFETLKRKRRVLDFSDLEHKTLDLLLGKNRSGSTAAAGEIGRRFREIMVDEYQDSNGVQDAIFDALSKDRQNCFLVGDVKQSIYQFRLADPGIFLDKYKTYLPVEQAESGKGRKVLLSHNFRSGPEVIECVNAVFRTAMRPKVGGLVYGEAEALREGIPQPPLPDTAIELYALDVQKDTYAEESAFVADRICAMLDSGTLVRKGGVLQPVQPDDIVILLRSPGSAAAAFQAALDERGIRSTTGAGSDLLQAEEICSVRAFLQVITNPRQDIPLISLLASPVFGFTADELAAIRSKQKKQSFFDALCLDESDKVSYFLKVLHQLRQEARMCSISALLESCFRLTKLDSIYGAMPDGVLRQKNIQLFYQLASDYEKQSVKDLHQFLDFLNSAESRGLLLNGSSATGSVTIMSIHKSKGLEFPVVFLSNLSRRFNMEDLRGRILCDKDLGLGLAIPDHKNRIRYPSAAKRAIAVKMAADSISEEMRVLYVAMTRARDRLVMTYASQSLEGDLRDIVLRQDLDSGELICREATCMGDWVLMEAIQRMEAGALHAIAGRPKQIRSGNFIWKISVCEAPKQQAFSREMDPVPVGISHETVSEIRESLLFRYPYTAATAAPSKRTATDSKGREKDAEVSEKTKEPPKLKRIWRTPSFELGTVSGKEYGNVIHTIMQYISYENTDSTDGIRSEVVKLTQKGFLTAIQAETVDISAVFRFFQSEIGQKLQSGTNHLREFKFSLLDEGAKYDAGLEGEQVLLQGVVDCALIEPDGITVLDFKTDYVTEESLPYAVSKYESQIHTYADALRRIFEMPVKKRYLYFFRLDRFVEM